jgi:glucosyl-3-phosphoglycerate synthase
MVATRGRMHPVRRSYRSLDFPAPRVLDAKRGRRVSVCLPARDEEATIGHIVATIRRELMETVPIVDEIVVINDGSRDRTSTVAAAAGATVVSVADVLADHAGNGKGQAMWKGVHVATGDVVVFCDADIRGFEPRFVLGLAGPLLARDDVSFVKGFYERGLDGRSGEGGRVTELMARPLISTFYPQLADLIQPLSGECAARREVLESLPFVGGYGVDLGLLIDVAEQFGNASLVQVDLGERVHRNRPLSELGPQALAVLQVVLVRARVHVMSDSEYPWTAQLLRPGGEPAEVTFTEMPPLLEVPAHRKTA